jgi:hypothetical protein
VALWGPQWAWCLPLACRLGTCQAYTWQHTVCFWPQHYLEYGLGHSHCLLCISHVIYYQGWPGSRMESCVADKLLKLLTLRSPRG